MDLAHVRREVGLPAGGTGAVEDRPRGRPGPDRVAAVVCQPDRARGRGRKVSPPPVKVVAERAGLPVLQPDSVRTPDFIKTLRAYAPDVLVVVAYGRILPEPLLRLAPLGAINVHGSLLPRHRGAAPIQWAIINGDEETGITIMQLDEGMDTGPVLLSVSTPIGPEDTAGALFARLAELGGRTLAAALDRLRRGEQGAADLVLAGWDCLALEEELIRRQAESALAEPAQDLLEVGLE